MPPRPDQPLASLFAFAAREPLVHPGPTLLLPSATQRRRLAPEAAAHPSNAQGWLLRGGADTGGWPAHSSRSFGEWVPGGARAVADAWGPTGAGVPSALGAAARKPALVDAWQDPAGYLLALSALAHCQAGCSSGGGSGSSSHALSAGAKRNGPIEAARLAWRSARPSELAAFEDSAAGEATFFWECAADYLALLSLGGGARAPRYSSSSSSSSSSLSSSASSSSGGRGERGSAAGASSLDARSPSERQALAKAADRLQRTVAAAEAAASSRGDRRAARLGRDASQEADLEGKLRQRRATARRAHGERPSRQRSTAAATAADARRVRRAGADAAAAASSARNSSTGRSASLRSSSSRAGSRSGRGVTFAGDDDEAGDEAFAVEEIVYHTAHVGGGESDDGNGDARTQGRGGGVDDKNEVSTEEEAPENLRSEDEEEDPDFGVNALNGHL
jgi:hypothetical protein